MSVNRAGFSLRAPFPSWGYLTPVDSHVPKFSGEARACVGRYLQCAVNDQLRHANQLGNCEPGAYIRHRDNRTVV